VSLPDVEAVPTLDAGQVARYLARVGVDEKVDATAGSLERLHVAHLLAVPFENLDIHTGRPIRLGHDALYDKIVTARRGGFCYELNGLFAALLASLGFDVTLVSSRVWLPDGTLSPPFDHAALLVDLGGPWLADVGYGDAFLTPQPLGTQWAEPGRRLRTLPTPEGWRLEMEAGEGWSAMYDLDPTPRRLQAFADRCRWHQTAPQSFFRSAPLASRATPTGRVSVYGRRLLITTDGAQTEHHLADDLVPGDALVASATPGHAMRAGDSPPTGTVLGKALQGSSEARGVIETLVMLQ
jgi:N-hydroxyarylamine O-acetyltransferase